MSTVLENYLNTKEAAAVIGCSDSRVRQMLIDGELNGKKVSERSWMVPRAEAERMANVSHDRGRPRKGS